VLVIPLLAFLPWLVQIPRRRDDLSLRSGDLQRFLLLVTQSKRSCGCGNAGLGLISTLRSLYVAMMAPIRNQASQTELEAKCARYGDCIALRSHEEAELAAQPSRFLAKMSTSCERR